MILKPPQYNEQAVVLRHNQQQLIVRYRLNCDINHKTLVLGNDDADISNQTSAKSAYRPHD